MPVIELNRATVLLAAVHRLQFLIALNVFPDSRHRNGKRYQEERHHEQETDENVTVFFSMATASPGANPHPSAPAHFSVMLIV
jgi:hypothetical protein